MSNNKQSSVDWLINEHFGGVENCTPDFRRKIEQAKAMEKEQIIDAFGVGCQVESTRLIGYHKMAEQYYKETYEQ